MITMKKITLLLLSIMLLTASFGQKADVYYAEAVEKSRAGKFRDAIKLFNKSIELQPDDYYSWYNRGIAKSMLDLYEEALADFDQTIKLAPDFKKAYLSRGVTKRFLTDYEGALADYSAAIEQDPEYGEAYYNRGLIYDLLAQTEAACADFDKAKDLGIKNAKRKTDKCNDTTAVTMPVHSILRLTKTATDGKYGFSEDNPVKVGTGAEGGPANQRAYLHLLRDAQGKPIKYKRIKSCCPHKSEHGFMGTALLDQYEIIYLNEKKKEKKAIVYISFYDYEEPQILHGFKTIGQ